MVPVHTLFASFTVTGTMIVQSPRVIYADNIITSSLPLTMAGQSHVERSGYVHDTSNDGSKDAFLAFDPDYRQELSRRAGPCLPLQVPTWWQQDNVPTATSLGPEFVCPEAYHIVTTLDTDESLKQVFCCPSQYRVLSLTGSIYLSRTGKHAFPSQYYTMISSGSTLEYRHPGRIYTTIVTTAKPDETISVFAVPVNGWAYISPTSSHSMVSRAEPMMVLTTSITTSTSTCAEESTASPLPMTPVSSPFSEVKSSATTPSHSTPSASGRSPGNNGGGVGYSESDKIALGVGIGVGLGVGLPSLILAFFQCRRAKQEANFIFMTTRDNAEREQL
ncbi:hypothetical protein F4782DRAFT_481005 [Xylaria castorea]|nr:hypothetical protein F4782DRAFT_481005 [Xylaria castorea]